LSGKLSIINKFKINLAERIDEWHFFLSHLMHILFFLLNQKTSLLMGGAGQVIFACLVRHREPVDNLNALLSV
jgi:hypothetical protein